MSETYEQYLVSYHGAIAPKTREEWTRQKELDTTLPSAARLSARAVLGLDLNALAQLEHSRNLRRGWWSHMHAQNIDLVRASKLLMMHTEISEATEGLRTDSMDSHLPSRSSIEVEIVDLLIRIFDFAGHMHLDLNGAWDDKSAYNTNRRDHDPAVRAASGGKKF